MQLIIGIIVIILLIMIIYLLYSALKDGWFLLLHKTGIQKALLKRTDTDRISQYLKQFPYYRQLSQEGQNKFLDRLITFMLNKEFKGGQGLIITEEMRVLVSASAIQLTFGLKHYQLESLETIILFPDTFFLNKYSPEYKGATKGRYMFLSWQAFKEGYRNTEDNLNLGLHEMTHALKLTLKLGRSFDKFFAGRMEYWEKMVNERFSNSGSKTSGLLRSYAKTNTEEFFAVCTEVFFESPEQFKKELPEIYYLLVFLLNQDPLNTTKDYTIDENYFESKYNIPLPEDVKPSYKYSASHWSMGILATGCIGSIPTFLFLSPQLILPYWGFLLIFLTAGMIGLLQKRYFAEQNILSGRYFIMYAFGGFGGSMFSILLWLNFLFPVSEMQSEKYLIKDYHAEYSTTKHGRRIFTGWRIELENELMLNSWLLTLNSKPKEGEAYLVFNYRYGILGIKKVENYYFTSG